MLKDQSPASSATLAKPAAQQANALEMCGLTKHYGSEVVVNGINLSIKQGEFFSLLGPSGSGKTSSLMMVAGFVSPDSGQILVGGRDVVPQTPQQRGFGMVFQNYAIFPHLNVFENVAFPLRARRVPTAEIKQRVMDALRMVHLERFWDRSSKQLSGGQQQRVALARAIVFHPPIVLMDEPMGALDKNLRYQMQAEIKEIQQRLRMTVLYVTHDQEEAMSMSDRLAIMNKGHIEQVASPLEVYERPNNVFVAQFLGQANFVRGVVTSLTGGLARIALPSGKTIVSRAAEGLRMNDRACVFVRPERLMLTQSAAPPEGNVNRLNGVVDRITYLGNVFRFHVSTDDGDQLTSEIPNINNLFRPAVGSRISIEWDTDSGLAMETSA
ncbi:ABC transporter ATP-binding protein [Azospirillum sp. A26]|uniref:ABC transporter ATP-binding protein n=1 Tax=Azospirillum sp. A26 TaxID=3160607 RepID=UPI00366E40B5